MEVDRSFAFVDLCGFTAYTEAHGSSVATQLLASFRLAVRDIASRRGVRIAKWLGDGAMIVGVETQPVLELLLEIEHRAADGSLALRYGVTFGKAILFEGDDYIGRPVNLAARLCDEALPHQLLVTASLFDASGDGLAHRRLGPHSIRGFTRPVEVVDMSEGGHHHVTAN